MPQSRSTESRGAWLFRKMSGIYGARFLDMWRDVNMRDVHEEWSAALRGIPRESIQLAIAKLYHTIAVPTLPEFIELCAPPRPVPLAHQHRIEDAVERTDSATARAKLAGIAGTITLQHQPGIGWARRIVEASKVEAVPALKLAMAQEAIRHWETFNAPPEREPGCDDEVISEWER